MIIVDFTNEELSHISAIGAGRTEANKYKKDIKDYDHRRFNLTKEQANKLGVMVEAALVKYFGYDILTCPMDTWISFYTPAEAKHYKNAPDVFHQNQWYDTRRVQKRTNPVVMRSKDVENDVIVVQGFVDYRFNDNGTIKVPRRAELTAWANPAVDWEDGWVPGYAEKNKFGEYDTHVIAGRRIEDLFPEAVAA